MASGFSSLITLKAALIAFKYFLIF